MLYPFTEGMHRDSSLYQICRTCVLDTSVFEIIFDSDGVCNFCHSIRRKIGRSWFPDQSGANRIRTDLEEIRRHGLSGGKKFDSILGLSGGLDSAVVAKRALDAGLRPLAVHVDAGWNTEPSVENVRAVVREFGLTLETVVIDWEQMRRLQLAFLNSGTLNQDIPQDHAFFVSLYSAAIRHKIPVILSGVNYATESVQPQSWGYSNSDGRHVLAIHSSHGSGRLKGFPIMPYRRFIRLGRKQAFQVVRPLDYGPYNPEQERRRLESMIGWRAYGGKHSESLFTDWFEAVYLVERYGIDKRRGHLASQIVSGLRTRDEALAELAKPKLDGPGRLVLNRSVAEKLGISNAELNELIRVPHVSNHKFKTEFKSWVSP